MRASKIYTDAVLNTQTAPILFSTLQNLRTRGVHLRRLHFPSPLPVGTEVSRDFRKLAESNDTWTNWAHVVARVPEQAGDMPVWWLGLR